MTTKQLPPPSVYWKESVTFWTEMLALHPDKEFVLRHLTFCREQLRLAETKEGDN